jgi:hypothetical protein
MVDPMIAVQTEMEVPKNGAKRRLELISTPMTAIPEKKATAIKYAGCGVNST